MGAGGEGRRGMAEGEKGESAQCRAGWKSGGSNNEMCGGGRGFVWMSW